MPAPRKAAGARKAAPPRSDTKPSASAPSVEDVLANYRAKANVSMQEYSDLVGNAARRLSGDAKDGANGWADDAVKFWGKVARDQVNVVSMCTDLMAAAARKPEAGGT